MSTHKEAARAVKWINGRIIEGSSVVCCRFMSNDEYTQVKQKERLERNKKKYEENKDKYLYVRNFDESVTEKDLMTAFSQFGKVRSVKIMRDEDGNSKKFGFVNFSSKRAARECLKKSCLIQINEWMTDRFTRLSRELNYVKKANEVLECLHKSQKVFWEVWY